MPVTPYTVQIVVNSHQTSNSGQIIRMANSYIYQAQSPSVGINKSAIWTAFKAAVQDLITARLASVCEGNGATIRQLEDTTDPATGFTYTDPGTGVSSPEETDICVSILLRTLKSGKNYKGAKRIGGLVQADTEHNEISTGTGIRTAWLAIKSAICANLTVGADTLTPGVYSRNLSPVVGTTRTVFFTALDPTHCRLNYTLGTMRHRKEKTVGNIP